MAPHIVGLFTAPSAGAPCVSHDRVEVVAGLGIPGDRYATRLGRWSDPKWPDQELTLIEAEVAESAGVEPGLLRRNVVTRDVRLDDLIGRTFTIGSAVLEGVRPCDPCAYIETLTQPGMLKALTAKGGLRVRVIASGHIAVGDAIMMASATASS